MGLKIYSAVNVFDAALARIRFLFAEFPNIVVGFSGGKDSTVVFNLALIVARELGRLPLKVMFLDQEAEWQATIDQVRLVMEHPDVEPLWVQVPIKLFNATSTVEHWLMCWNPEDEHRWMRPRETYSLHENVYGTDRFGEMFAAILAHHYPDTPTCYLAGVRTEESPTRFVGLTHFPTYKGRTWGKVLNKRRGHYTMYPVYDWGYSDVWCAIHQNKWEYNSIYDAQYSYGVKLKDMRVSNVHHETAVHALFYMQEVEPETYQKLTQRISGIDMAGKMGTDDYFVDKLPFMFANWREYRDFLLEKMIENPVWKENFRKEFARLDVIYTALKEETLCKVQISSILTNDWEMIKLANFERRPAIYVLRKQHLGKAAW